MRLPLRNRLFQGIILLILYFVYPFTALANFSGENHQNSSLISRQVDWPEWKLPGPFHPSGLKRDIIYPPWFAGIWIVESTDLTSPENKHIEYQAKFKLINSKEAVGDRSFNALSVGKSILGDQLLSVKDDPSSPNRQLAKFIDNGFLETKVIGRNQSFENEAEFFVDELSLQIFHSLDISRVKRVETLSKYQFCNSTMTTSEGLSVDKICGEQWQAIYPEPGKNLFLSPYSLNNYRLILDPV